MDIPPLLIVALVIALLAAFDVLASVAGVDSRDGFGGVDRPGLR